MTREAARGTRDEALLRMHANAVRIADDMATAARELGIRVATLDDGARLIDAGVEAEGSYEAGRLFSEACLGGLGQVALAPRTLAGAPIREARVSVRQPLCGCMASQYAGWKIRKDRFFAMGSGPARSLAAAEPLFEKYPLRSRAERSVLLLETSALPTAEVAALVAGRCGLEPRNLTLIAASTGRAAGVPQIAARSVETALHKLMELGFDLTTITAGAGVCPIAPVTADPLEAIGRTNDAILYGAEVTLWLRAPDRAIEEVIERVPASASRDYGRPFRDLFQAHGGDFYRIDPLLFSPARVTLVNAPGGSSVSAGRLDEAILARSFGLAGGS